MTGEDLFWKMRYAISGYAVNQYTRKQTVDMRAGADGVTMRMKIEQETDVAKSSDPFGINEMNRVKISMMDMEIEQYTRTYYRLEDGELVGYVFADTIDYCEQLPVDMTIIDLQASYAFSVVPNRIPKNISLDEDLQELDGREVYVLRYDSTLLEIIKKTGDETIDAELEKISVPYVTYVDTQTLIPLRLEISVSDMDDVISKLIYAAMEGNAAEDVENIHVEISEYTITVDNFVFGAVEVPDIPQEDLDRITGSEEPAGEANEL